MALEAGWNWGVLYDWLERIKNVEEIQLAHPKLGSEIGVRELLLTESGSDSKLR